MEFEGSSAIVTGGASGLGEATARTLAAKGMRVTYDTVPNPAEFKAKLARDVVFPRRLGRSEEFASLAWELIHNPYVNGEVFRLDAGVRLPPK